MQDLGKLSSDLSELGINIALLILFVVSFLLSLIPKYFFKKNE